MKKAQRNKISVHGIGTANPLTSTLFCDSTSKHINYTHLIRRSFFHSTELVLCHSKHGTNGVLISIYVTFVTAES